MPALQTLPQALATAATFATGITFVDAGRAVRRSYQDVLDTSQRVAAALRAAGVRRGDVAALVLVDPEQFLTALFGASIAGVVPALLQPPVITGGPEQYFNASAAILRHAGARAVLTHAALVDRFAALRPECPELSLVLDRDALEAPPVDLAPGADLDELAVVQFTSGSTSSPRGIALSHANIAANVAAVNGPAGLTIRDDDVAVSWLPLHHDMGLVGMIFGALYTHRPAVVMRPETFVKRPAEWLRAITRYRGTISFAPNFAYDLCVRRVRERDLEGLDLSSWRIAGCGAEPIQASTLAAFAEKFAPVGFRSSSFRPSYGLAEHVVAACVSTAPGAPRVEHLDAGRLAEGREAVPVTGQAAAIDLVSCGRALPNHQIGIMDDRERLLEDRAVGEIVLAGPSVMLGYYKNETLTAETIRGGWLHTGDLGYLAGGDLFVCGRAKDLVIVNGLKYHPQDLEWAVDALPGVRRGRVVAFAASQPGAGDRVVIVAEPSGTVASEALTDAIRRRIGALFGLYVDEIRLVPSGTVGRTTSGKVQRAATKGRYQSGDLMPSAAGREATGL
jgi:fatty-acyl-CoA synthase